MPLLYTHNINDRTRLGVWHITESEEFFRKIVVLQNEISHPHKRLQHLAGRFLLKILDTDFPVGRILLDGRRPYLEKNTFHFSISHCGIYAAAIVSKDIPVGIDVELVSEKLEILEKKYLGEDEMIMIRENNIQIPLLEKLTACWSAKEAMFKWYAKGKVDFRKDMIINQMAMQQKRNSIRAKFGKEINQELLIHFRFFNGVCLAWVK